MSRAKFHLARQWSALRALCSLKGSKGDANTDLKHVMALLDQFVQLGAAQQTNSTSSAAYWSCASATPLMLAVDRWWETW